MTVKSRGTPARWVDPDDAPELTDDFFHRATPSIGERVATKEAYAQAARKRMGRPPVALKRPTLNMRVDADVMAALKASGRGWQTRLNSLLRREVLGKGK